MIPLLVSYFLDFSEVWWAHIQNLRIYCAAIQFILFCFVSVQTGSIRRVHQLYVYITDSIQHRAQAEIELLFSERNKIHSIIAAALLSKEMCCRFLLMDQLYTYYTMQ